MFSSFAFLTTPGRVPAPAADESEERSLGTLGGQTLFVSGVPDLSVSVAAAADASDSGGSLQKSGLKRVEASCLGDWCCNTISSGGTYFCLKKKSMARDLN
jgi:hypothetical protein